MCPLLLQLVPGMGCICWIKECVLLTRWEIWKRKMESLFLLRLHVCSMSWLLHWGILLNSYTGCSRLPQSTAAAVGEFQEDQWRPIDRVGELTSAFREEEIIGSFAPFIKSILTSCHWNRRKVWERSIGPLTRRSQACLRGTWNLSICDSRKSIARGRKGIDSRPRTRRVEVADLLEAVDKKVSMGWWNRKGRFSC